MRSMCSVMAVLSSSAMRWNSSPSASTSLLDRVRMRSSNRSQGGTVGSVFTIDCSQVPYSRVGRMPYNRRSPSAEQCKAFHFKLLFNSSGLRRGTMQHGKDSKSLVTISYLVPAGNSKRSRQLMHSRNRPAGDIRTATRCSTDVELGVTPAILTLQCPPASYLFAVSGEAVSVDHLVSITRKYTFSLIGLAVTAR
jgi:hypothetical protein